MGWSSVGGLAYRAVLLLSVFSVFSADLAAQGGWSLDLDKGAQLFKRFGTNTADSQQLFLAGKFAPLSLRDNGLSCGGANARQKHQLPQGGGVHIHPSAVLGGLGLGGDLGRFARVGQIPCEKTEHDGDGDK